MWLEWSVETLCKRFRSVQRHLKFLIWIPSAHIRNVNMNPIWPCKTHLIEVNLSSWSETKYIFSSIKDRVYCIQLWFWILTNITSFHLNKRKSRLSLFQSSSCNAKQTAKLFFNKNSLSSKLLIKFKFCRTSTRYSKSNLSLWARPVLTSF